jgi:hypothetical protein
MTASMAGPFLGAVAVRNLQEQQIESRAVSLSAQFFPKSNALPATASLSRRFAGFCARNCRGRRAMFGAPT